MPSQFRHGKETHVFKEGKMKTTKFFLFFFLLVSILVLGGGCATLPNVTETIREAPTSQEPRQIASAKGLLSPKQSKALMERLQRSVDATDMVQRYSAVIESVSESPLTKGNKVTLLVDGPPHIRRHVQGGRECQRPHQH